VAEVSFVEWTRDGLLRHPEFIGVRDDKRPHEVRRDEG
jgi:bifunctional non-homologous end joining protein LigD